MISTAAQIRYVVEAQQKRQASGQEKSSSDNMFDFERVARCDAEVNRIAGLPESELYAELDRLKLAERYSGLEGRLDARYIMSGVKSRRP